MEGTLELDGRRRHRLANRELVLDALLAFFREGVFQPGTAAVAERAGLSPRSLFRYFDDVEDLHRAATERQLRRALPLTELDVSPEQATAAKVDALVASRAALFEEIGPGARAARVWAHRQPEIAAQLRHDRGRLREQVRELFAPELATASVVTLPALDAVAGFETWDLLREDQGLGVGRAAATISAALTALLTSRTGE